MRNCGSGSARLLRTWRSVWRSFGVWPDRQTSAMMAVRSCRPEARKKSSRTPLARPLSLMIHDATDAISSSVVPPYWPTQSRALKPVSGLRGSRTLTRRPASSRCLDTLGATSLEGSSTMRAPPHFSAVGIVTDVVLKPPDPANTIPCEEPNEPSKHRSGDVPPAPHVSLASARKEAPAIVSRSTRYRSPTTMPPVSGNRFEA